MSTTTTTTTTTTTAITTTDLFRAAYRAIRRVHPSQSRTEVLKRARKSVAKAGIRTPRGAGWVIERAVDLALRPGPKPPKTLEQRRAIARARRDQRDLALFVPEIRRRGGEIAIQEERAEVPLKVLSRSREGFVLLGCDGWRQYSRRFGARPATLLYLCGVDDAGPWAVRVPGTLTSAAEAAAWVEPAEVTQARDAGRRVLRQGDIYVVEARHDRMSDADLPASHRWRPETRYLVHEPEDGRKHRPLRVSFPARVVRQRVYQMGRGGSRAFGD